MTKKSLRDINEIAKFQGPKHSEPQRGREL
ncbi:hypothetical protein CCACVL1_11125 [Corchorus capsularis]|uniref:Uncharacterized protein n=1 Tax=Corchorus capsularis TaxID=210143 RepID=A0A1R3IMR4_COCAP|nr:hypothetical protein CCACVL1_11125 [Corchorus capsularis]